MDFAPLSLPYTRYSPVGADRPYAAPEHLHTPPPGMSVGLHRLRPTLLLLLAALLAACSGGGVLARGGWLFDGNDVVEVRARGAQDRVSAVERVVTVLERGNVPVEAASRRAGYVYSVPLRLNDTLQVRLNIVVPDSVLVEVAGQKRTPATGGTWTRIAWSQDRRGAPAWSFLTDVSGRIGNIAGYSEDPAYAAECGRGRSCDSDDVCRNNVCYDPETE